MVGRGLPFGVHLSQPLRPPAMGIPTEAHLPIHEREAPPPPPYETRPMGAGSAKSALQRNSGLHAQKNTPLPSRHTHDTCETIHEGVPGRRDIGGGLESGGTWTGSAHL